MVAICLRHSSNLFIRFCEGRAAIIFKVPEPMIPGVQWHLYNPRVGSSIMPAAARLTGGCSAYLLPCCRIRVLFVWIILLAYGGDMRNKWNNSVQARASKLRP